MSIDKKDYEDNFLDNLMNNLMNNEDNSHDNRESKENSEVTENIPITKRFQNEESEIESKPKRSGLLNRIGAKSKDSNNENSQQENINFKEYSTPINEDRVHEDSKFTNENKKAIGEIVEDTPAEKVSSSNRKQESKGNSLLERMKKRRQESLDIENEIESIVESVDKVEEFEKEVEEDYNGNISTENANEPFTESRDDTFEALLRDVVEEEEIIIPKKGREFEAEVPLETKEMSEIKVTPDGRSLADMLIGLRSGNNSVINKVAKVRNQEEIVEIRDKKFSDARYLKHVKSINKEAEENKKRVELSNKFLQRNASFTEQEKIIMKNLGLDNKELSKVMKSKKMTKKEKERILSLGRYGAEKYFKGRRFRTTVGDSAMLEFLTKFKYANTRILRWISNEPQGKTWRKLNRLKDTGLVESKSILGMPDLWGATPSGVAISGYALKPGLRPMPKIPTIASDMGINYIAACLWFNKINVLNLDDFPAKNRVIALQEDGRDRVEGEMLVSELEIRSSLGKEINPASTTMRTLGDERLYDVISANVRSSFDEWGENGRIGESPEFALGNEYMWVLYPTSQLTLSYHVPDLVVKRERGPNGEPRSIAVEMERYEKTNDKYDKIMLAYKLDEHLYEKVVWLTPNNKVAKALQRAAENVGFDRYSILPIITETGVYDKQDIWMI